MPRRQKGDPAGYNKPFPLALRKLLTDSGTTKKDLAAYLNKSGQAVTYYCDGTSSPDWETIVAIAKYFSVSTDYLLGASDDPAPQPSAVDDLGLSPKAVQYLRTLHELSKMPPYDTRLSLLSYLLESQQFDLMLSLCIKYVALMGTTPDPAFESSADYKSCADTLKAHGFVVSLPDDQANSLFSERITNLLRTILEARAEHTGG